MPVTQTDIDNLNAAIAGGEKIVRINGKEVEFRSVEALITARADQQRQLDAQNAVSRPRIVYHTHSGRGY